MKIPKSFFYFLAIVQSLLILGHYALYAALLFIFPALLAYHVALIIAAFLLSISFLALSIVTFRNGNFLLRWLYIISAVWMPTWFYLLLACLIIIIIKGIFPAEPAVIDLILALAAILVSVYGIINARIHRIINIKLALPNLPEFWRGKTAVVVSDLHLGHVLRKDFAKKIIAKINSLRPDIIFIPGDFFDGVKTDFAGLANLFKELKAEQGIYYVTGNHEAIAGYKICEQAIGGAGIHILENQKVEVLGLQIAGLAYAGGETIKDVEKNIKAMNLNPALPSILLKHVPNHALAIANLGINLQLSGHTHLGQVWPGGLITRLVFKGFDYGLKQAGKNFIYTSSGVGTWGPPMRVFTKSEIVRIRFE